MSSGEKRDKKITTAEIAAITAASIAGIAEHDRDEMAIPSYLHANPLIRWLMWRRYETVAELLHPGPEKSALEFGCGIGLFLPQLDAAFGKVYAVDLFPQVAQELCRRYSLRTVFLTGAEEIENRSLDAIVAADVLEHVEDLAGFLSLFREKLRAGGEFVVSGPTESLVYRLGRTIAGFGGKGDYHHTNIDNLIADITQTGFALRETRRLPFPGLPTLFKVCRFEKASRKFSKH